MEQIKIRELDSKDLLSNLKDLATILHASVSAGASVGFILPYSPEDSEDFWKSKVYPSLKNKDRLLLVATVDKKIAGTVQLDMDMLPNQVHRCEVLKLLVHPEFRRKGIARKLMIELEKRADYFDRSLITLDTRTGDTAEPFYRSLGYEIAGVIPGYCRAAEKAHYDATTYMYKRL
ncbi:GNAT family N-acetyltransferase [Alphaproteobacteria bacterium 46_93_T64]|nr:GNAT family N-acetyltransferase [Alphaproteobacteria bacterium 46_93_T64]